MSTVIKPLESDEIGDDNILKEVCELIEEHIGGYAISKQVLKNISGLKFILSAHEKGHIKSLNAERVVQLIGICNTYKNGYMCPQEYYERKALGVELEAEQFGYSGYIKHNGYIDHEQFLKEYYDYIENCDKIPYESYCPDYEQPEEINPYFIYC